VPESRAHEPPAIEDIQEEFPEWKAWTSRDDGLIHACIPWDTNMYVTADTLEGLRDGIVGGIRARAYWERGIQALAPRRVGERHDFRVREARRLLAENCQDAAMPRNYLRLLVQLADDSADTEVDDERTYTLLWGGLHISARDLPLLCKTCSAKLAEVEREADRAGAVSGGRPR
jgi:hypothetical protein